MLYILGYISEALRQLFSIPEKEFILCHGNPQTKCYRKLKIWKVPLILNYWCAATHPCTRLQWCRISMPVYVVTPCAPEIPATYVFCSGIRIASAPASKLFLQQFLLIFFGIKLFLPLLRRISWHKVYTLIFGGANRVHKQEQRQVIYSSTTHGRHF